VRVVLDTNVVASAILWGGTPRVLLQAAREKRISWPRAAATRPNWRG
jgi:predicted nucleic acid-binding protein